MNSKYYLIPYDWYILTIWANFIQGVNDRGVTSVEGGAYGGINGRNKGHQVAGFSTSYQKNESGNKATYYDDGLGHGGVIQYGAKDQR